MADKQAAVDATASVLAAMKGEVLARKSSALTPVAGEVRVMPLTVVPSTPAPFPNDQPQEVIEGIIRDLERQYTHLGEVIDALRLTIGQPATDIPATAVELAANAKAAEREADARAAEREAIQSVETDEVAMFKAELARLKAEAQAAFHKADLAREADLPEVPLTVLPNMVEDGWTCPTHGGFVVKTSARRKVDYRACPEDCGEFERV